MDLPSAKSAPPIQPFVVGNDLYGFDMTMDSYTIDSKLTGEKLRVDVSYLSNCETRRNPPSVYLTDGHWRRIDHKYVHYLTRKGVIPPVLVVGVGYPREEYDHDRIWQTRMKDLVRSPDPFLASLGTEVIPVIEEKYGCDPLSRLLFGASAGGTFSAYACFRNALDGNMLFRGYIGSSAFLRQSNTLELARELVANSGAIDANLYLTHGGLENDPDFGIPHRQLVALLEGVRSAGPHWNCHVYPDRDHYTNTRVTLVDGVRLFLGKPEQRGVELRDLSYASFAYDFANSVAVRDWEADGALTQVTHSTDPGRAADGRPRSMVVLADFQRAPWGSIETTFDHFEDLTGKEIEFVIDVPEQLAKLDYELRFSIASTYEWKHDVSEVIPITKGGPNHFKHTWGGHQLLGDAKLARKIALGIQKPSAAPAWRGQLHFDHVRW
jgi:enterochelin esterase-like enzyme